MILLLYRQKGYEVFLVVESFSWSSRGPADLVSYRIGTPTTSGNA